MAQTRPREWLARNDLKIYVCDLDMPLEEQGKVMSRVCRRHWWHKLDIRAERGIPVVHVLLLHVYIT
jgi:hypothetical protein